MRKWRDNMKGDFFKGRYGIDFLSVFLLIIASSMLGLRSYYWTIGLVLIGYVVLRALSKNITKRSKEQQALINLFRRIWDYIQGIFKTFSRSANTTTRKYKQYKNKRSQRSMYTFVKCPNCKKGLRLPKNKGKLKVTCPKCKETFIKKT